ncbi:hypothetical protein ACPEEZ_01550 [Frigoribacterium sp. 2-23]|uniref:hypothetical protein n=1 Tax=Frigoribacterium sp. 2-23 TaxID=3415006 RepID=UPI003C7037F2
MSNPTYTASFVASNGTKTEQLEYIDGLPQKSLVRPDSKGDDLNWELDESSSVGDAYVYRSLGVAEHDYS